MKAALFCRMFVIATALVMVTACTQRRQPAPPPPQISAPTDSIEKWLHYLTLEEKVGQLLWFGIDDANPGPETEQLVREARAGGFILFARQAADPAGLRDLTGGLQALAAGRDRATPGLWIAADQEGGLVQRFLTGFTAWPGAMAIGATGSEVYAEQVAKAMALELKSAGLNLNLAPVADVNNNPANPVIGVRSFGEDPQLAARLVAASIRGFRAGGIGAAAKHFPGHGNTSIDSHQALPIVGHTRDQLEQVELVPFRAAIAAGADVIMTAHIHFPAVVASGLPATLSPEVIQGLLKAELGFQGLVVTDALDTMKAISERYGLEQALVLAVNAGADGLLVTESFGRQAELHRLLVAAVRSGEIAEARLEDAVRRQLTAKDRLGLLPSLPAGIPVQREAKSDPLPAVDLAEHRRLTLEVGGAALTLVKNRHLPLRLTDGELILAIGPAYAAEVTGQEGIRTALGAGLKQHHPNVREVALGYRPTADALAAAHALAAQASAVVYGVYNGHSYPEHQAFLKELIATKKPVIVVGMGEPYELTAVPEIETYIAAYGYRSPNLQGVGALIFGKADATGRLPIQIPGSYQAGHGLSL